MSSLTLAPWECNSSFLDCKPEMEQAVYSILWNGKYVPSLFQSFRMRSRPYVFVRPLESRDEGNWLVCKASDSHIKPIPDVQAYIAHIAASLLAQEKTFLLARFCVVDEERDGGYESKLFANYAVLFEDGEGNWLSDDLRELASFAFVMDRETFRQNGRAVNHFFENAIRDAASDIAFARYWAAIGAKEKASLLLQGESNKKQIEAVMRWTLQCEPQLWQTGDEWRWFLPGPYVEATNEDVWWITEAQLPLIFRMHRFLLQHHIPGLSYSLCEQHSCTRKFANLDDYGHPSEIYASVKVSGFSTAHERLEARLQLRDWLQQNAYPEEIEAIGPF